MHRLIFFLPVLLFLTSVPALFGLKIDSEGIKNKALYGIEFPGNARAYYAQEAGVQSISKQEYRTAAFSVAEINIVTNGNALLRIYHSRLLQPGELQEDAANTTQAVRPGYTPSIIAQPLPPGMQALAEKANAVNDALTNSTVVKEYPFATHARTIEFRVRSRAELLKLFEALKKHWLKEPALFENGQIVSDTETTEADGSSESIITTQSQMKPRSLGGTLFTIEQ